MSNKKLNYKCKRYIYNVQNHFIIRYIAKTGRGKWGICSGHCPDIRNTLWNTVLHPQSLRLKEGYVFLLQYPFLDECQLFWGFLMFTLSWTFYRNLSVLINDIPPKHRGPKVCLKLSVTGLLKHPLTIALVAQLTALRCHSLSVQFCVYCTVTSSSCGHEPLRPGDFIVL